ncbi:uncharacterized protein H6S33_006176 [Morchella sextelata]|uniref:uncharacterized protein n=1 Tax=Morchella sextelata TaxID=1174677 RepID=UPI001D056593|nr:uncharacterized protein H6S33_006176 [Morchella sextelata]KAH0614290.1 hypothetical protein H6S33_006176 [Morchella sextelata]
MLTRQCRSQFLIVHPQQRLLLRSFSTGNDEDHTRRLLRRRMSIGLPADTTGIGGGSGHGGLGRWDEAPPTFSWSRIQDGVLPSTRPKGVHYQLTDIGTTTSAFLSAIFKPIQAFFPTRINEYPPPPPPKPLSIATPTSTRALRDLEEGILSTEKSLKWISSKHRALKSHSPYLQLSSRAVVSLFQRLLEAGMYKRFLEVLESEDVLAEEGVDLVWMSLEKYDAVTRRRILEGLCETCKTQHRQRFRGMLMGLDYKVEKDLHMDVLNETAQMLSQILVVKAPTEKGYAAEVAKATVVAELSGVCDKIAAGTVKIGVETSQAVFRRFLELGGINDAVKYALKPAVNVPGAHNIARLCDALCDKFRYQDAYRLIIDALKVQSFGFISDLDVRAGVRTVDRLSGRTEDELVDLWEALNASYAISIRDITKDTFAAFIGRASRLKFGRRSQWWEGNGATPLLKMCMEIIILRLRGEVNTTHLATLMEAWIWNWQGDEDKRVDTTSLDESIPFLPNFLDILSHEQLDQVLIMCEYCGPLWALEGAVLRKGLASKYLAFRSDPEIARFVVRQYLPFRMAVEGADGTEKENAKAVFMQLRGMDNPGGITITNSEGNPEAIGPFAHAILAFKDTGIPCRTLLLDMVYTLYRLMRPQEIVELLRALNAHGIRPSSSQYSLLIRTLTPTHPSSALSLLKLYAKSQYSVFAAFIASTASTHPHLAIAAYRFLTRPNVFPFTPDQPCLAPRRLPKRRLLLAMAWKFANSPALTARQCQRWVHICYGTMLKLGYAPGPTMGLAIAVAAVQRTIREGIPVSINSARQRWVIQAVKRQAGTRKAEEVARILKRCEDVRRERNRHRNREVSAGHRDVELWLEKIRGPDAQW